MIYMSREQTPSKGGDKQTWPRKAPCSPSALAFFAPSLQIKSGIPRLGLSYPRSYHCINFTPHHSFRECKKQLLKPNIVSDSPKRGLSILIVWGFLTYHWQNLCCILYFWGANNLALSVKMSERLCQKGLKLQNLRRVESLTFKIPFLGQYPMNYKLKRL